MEKCHGVKPVSQKIYATFTVFYEISAYTKDQNRPQLLVKCPLQSFLLSNRQHSLVLFFFFKLFFFFSDCWCKGKKNTLSTCPFIAEALYV